MSGQTVTGLGLQFTDDNKFCSGYSGTIAIGSGDTTMLSFTTTDVYIKGELNFSGVWGNMGSSAVTMKLSINGKDIIFNTVSNTSARNVEGTPYPILLPPNSIIVVSMSQASGSDRNFQATLIGDVGMAQRVGN